MNTPSVPISWGELIDKVTILEIKKRSITGETARSNINRELRLLSDIANPLIETSSTVCDLKSQLSTINQKLWTVEDDIREMESLKNFGAEFVVLARSVYQLNDKRASLKKAIDLEVGSELTEEKSYKS